ncbi:ribonuclease P protein component [Hyphobacterium marinum]|uniref:ribonuclease P protein component n=1 Tax=Hyphobacterium marinum TaxID=3116574 RepID=UPI00359FDFBC
MPVGRLTVRREFLHAAKGKKAVRPGLVLQARSGLAPADSCRAGFTATKKIGGAVQRNRAKRRLREAARLLLPLYGQAGVDYVFIARATTGARDWPHLLDDVKSALLTLARPASGGRTDEPQDTRPGAHGR